MILGIVPIGMNCACTFTVTGVEELIVASGKLNGLALIGIPFAQKSLKITFLAFRPAFW